MSILTVGGTGAVGSEFTRTLARQGYEVRALVRGGLSHRKSKQLLEAGVQIVEGDLCRHDTIGRAVRSVETVICSATSMPSADNDGLRTVDRDGTLALIRAAELEGVKRFVYVSYSGNIRQDSPLENAKRDCEDSLKNGSMETFILRPSYFMEVWLTPALGFDPANRSVRVYGSGESKVSYISSSNVAAFAVDVAIAESSAKSTILELGGPEALSQLEVVHLFEQLLGQQMKVEHVPIEAMQMQHQSSNPLQKTFGALMLAYATGDVVHDAVANAQQHRIQLRSVTEYAPAFK